MKKLIYVNGDSYTAGEELGDYTLPGWPGTHKLTGSSFSNINTKWMRDRVKLIPDFHSYSKIQKKLSWAGQLENENLTVINGSKSGASMTGIAMRTMYDLLKLQQEGQIPDIVLIQLTSFDRIEVFTTEDPDYGFLDSPLAHFSLTNPNIQNLARQYIATYSDSDLVVKFLYGLITLQNTVLGITGKHPVLLSTPLSSHSTNIVCDNERDDLIEMSMIKKLDEFNLPMVHFQSMSGCIMPGSHSDMLTHSLFAEEIYNKYIKNL